MKNMIRASLLAVAVTLFGTVLYAQKTATISLTANVIGTDALTCLGPAAFGTITPGTAAVPTADPTCTVTDNDASGDTLTVYISSADALVDGANAIPATAPTLYASGSALSDTTAPSYAYLSLTPLSTTFTGSAALGGNVGLDVGTFPPDVSPYTTTLHLSLTAPSTTPVGSYVGTLNVVLTPIS